MFGLRIELSRITGSSYLWQCRPGDSARVIRVGRDDGRERIMPAYDCDYRHRVELSRLRRRLGRANYAPASYLGDILTDGRIV